jgi:hypothetical protein
MSDEAPPRCAECGGPIMRRTNVGRPEGDPEAPWLHVHDEDWIGNPHEARPA